MLEFTTKLPLAPPPVIKPVTRKLYIPLQRIEPGQWRVNLLFCQLSHPAA
jgi:hypothetical protein